MSADLTGTCLTLDDGRPAVRFSRTYDHPIDRVWQFVTDVDELAHWFRPAPRSTCAPAAR